MVSAQKRALRKASLDILKGIPAEARTEADARIRQWVKQMPQYRQADKLFMFVGTGWEVDTWPLAEEALADGKQVAVPRCLPMDSGPGAQKPGGVPGDAAFAGGVMEACLIKSRASLRQVPPMNLWEPEPGTPVLQPSAVAFALIPCITCDISGRRLGRGGGYYDRFLKQGSFTKVALCRQVVLQETLPTQAHDEKVDFVVTEDGILDCRHVRKT